MNAATARIRVGLIGAGRIGQVHGANLAGRVSGARLVAIADIHRPAAESLAAGLGVPTVASDYRDLLDDSEIDAVVICSATSTHTEVIESAAAAGKHIFCEKPLSLTLAGCDRAIEAVNNSGVMLQMGFMRRFDPDYVAARRLIDEGRIGRPVMVKSTGRDPDRTPLEFARRSNSGGLVMDMGVHDFDLARWLMGAEVERVSTEGGCLVYPELAEVGDIDNAVVNLRFEDGRIGNVDVSRNAKYGYDIRTEVLGSAGSLWIGRIHRTGLSVLTVDGVAQDTFPGFVERFDHGYLNEMQDFVDNLLNGRPPSVSGRDARAATAIAVAATRSLDDGRPVRIDEVDSRESVA